MSRIRFTSVLPVPPSEVFAWHTRPGAVARLAPPWERIRFLAGDGAIRPGRRLAFAFGLGPIRRRWDAVVTEVEEGRRFRHEQLAGPFARWERTCLFEPHGERACRMTDEVDCRLPAGRLGDLIAGRYVRRRVEAILSYAHETLRRDLIRHERARDRGPLRIAMTGASGLVGTPLGSFLTAGGHRLVRLVRRTPAGPGDLFWDPMGGRIDAEGLEGLDAVIHLAGENLGQGRWTPARKAILRASRVEGTRLLARTLARLRRPPRVFVSASAVGYYGDRGEEELIEESPPGSGFLPDLCRAWEAAAQPAREAGIRVVNLRMGVVLSAAGGALARMLPAFRWGTGAVIGSGRQYLSWISLEELIGIIHHTLFAEDLFGPVNAVSPAPVAQRRFAQTLARVLGRPALMRLPAPFIRALFGEMGQAALLEGQRVLPRALEMSAYGFAFPDLEGALRWELGRTGPRA